MWTATGVFTGAWGFLMAASPYIIAGAVLVTAAVKMASETDIGNWFTVLGFTSASSKPDVAFASVVGTKLELLQDMLNLRNKLVKESGKEYTNIYGFSSKKDQLKLSFEMSTPIALPLKDEQAKTLWDSFAVLCPSLVDDELPFF